MTPFLSIAYERALPATDGSHYARVAGMARSYNRLIIFASADYSPRAGIPYTGPS